MSSGSVRDRDSPITRARRSIRCFPPRSGSPWSASFRTGANRISRNRSSTASASGCCRRSSRRSLHLPMQGCSPRPATTSWAACSCRWSSTRRRSPGSAPRTPRPRAMRCSRSATPTCCSLTVPRPRSMRSCDRCWRDARWGPCASPSRRRAPRSPTSRPAPNPTARARSGRAIGCTAARCGSRAASTSSPTTSCILCSRRFRARRRASGAFRFLPYRAA